MHEGKCNFANPKHRPTHAKVRCTYTSRWWSRHTSGVGPHNSRIPTCGQTNGLIKSSAPRGGEERERHGGWNGGTIYSRDVDGKHCWYGLLFRRARGTRTNIRDAGRNICRTYAYAFSTLTSNMKFFATDHPRFPLIVFSALAKIMRYCWRTSTIAPTGAIIGKNAQWGPFVPYARGNLINDAKICLCEWARAYWHDSLLCLWKILFLWDITRIKI